MKNNIIQDERITAQKRNITSEAFLFVMIFLIGSVLVKQFVFKASFSGYATEFISFFGASLYLLVRNIFVGNSLFQVHNQKKLIITNSLVIGITLTVVMAFLHFNQQKNISEFVITLVTAFAISTLGAFICFSILNMLSRLRIKKLEKQFDDELEK